MERILRVLGIALVFYIGWGSCQLSAQENSSVKKQKELQVKKHTVLAKYEPNMVVPAEERLQLKKDRIATIRERREIIDTLDISERKRRQLLKELYRTPFSYKLDKVIANNQPEDEEEEDH